MGRWEALAAQVPGRAEEIFAEGRGGGGGEGKRGGGGETISLYIPHLPIARPRGGLHWYYIARSYNTIWHYIELRIGVIGTP